MFYIKYFLVLILFSCFSNNDKETADANPAASTESNCKDIDKKL